MRKLFVTSFLLTAVMLLQFCASSKKATAVAAVTYEKNIMPVIQGSCAPCHIAGKGNKKSLDNYLSAKDDIDDIIARIQKAPDERGFMPFKHPKLSDSTITVFVDWKKQGLKEK